MNLVTQCPQCALLFQVPHESLSQAQGWVRCGQCQHLFEGETFAIKAPVLDVPLHAESSDDSPRVDVEALLRRQDIPTQLDGVAPAVVPLPPVSANASAVTAASVQADLPERAPIKANLHHNLAPHPMAPTGVGLHRFMALVLALGLSFQALFFFKDEIAAQLPASRSVWAQWCQPLACTVKPLRRWSGIVIDNSSLVRGDTGYALNLTLRNSLDVALATTALELTLTDEQDRPVVRRVLSPAELGAPAELAAGQTWVQVLHLEPTPVVADIAGYRLVSFYP
jgi:predicted Zn finger-like uncharacterized protein